MLGLKNKRAEVQVWASQDTESPPGKKGCTCECWKQKKTKTQLLVSQDSIPLPSAVPSLQSPSWGFGFPPCPALPQAFRQLLLHIRAPHTDPLQTHLQLI